MTDLKLRKKRSPSGSLTRRILSIVILLLVIPLFLQSLFLYRQEYRQKLADVEADLQLLVSERARFLEEMIQIDWQILGANRWGLNMGPNSIPNRILRTGASCSGISSNVKQIYMERIPLPRGLPEQFVIVSKSQEAILVGVTESDTTALVLQIPFSFIGRDLPRGYPIQISLVKRNGKVFWENMKLSGSGQVIEVTDLVGQTDLKVVLRVDQANILGLHHQSYYLRFASLLFFVGVIGGGAVFFFTRRIAKPLRHLSEVMSRVSEGAAHARFQTDKMGFEINALGMQFNETLDDLLMRKAEVEKERIKREKLAKELSIGHEIQSNLLPKHVIGFKGLDLGAQFLAAREVNGDFYDFFELPDGRLLINICDTAGKGISACLFSLGLRSMIRSFASCVTDLSELIRRVNDLYMADAHEASMFSTIWMGIYDPKEKKLTYCSQGHPPAALIRGIALEELWTEGIALGAQKIDVIQIKEIVLIEGDLLAIYTDGITEAHNPNDELFGKERLYEVLLRKQKVSSGQIASAVIEEVELFASGSVQHDDMTLLILRVSS